MASVATIATARITGETETKGEPTPMAPTTKPAVIREITMQMEPGRSRIAKIIRRPQLGRHRHQNAPTRGNANKDKEIRIPHDP